MRTLLVKLGVGLIAIVSFSFLLGCDKNNSTAGLNLISSPSIQIEFYDKENKGDLQFEVEILSFIDEITGMSFMQPQTLQTYTDVFVHTSISLETERFNYVSEGLFLKRHYVAKYKVPSIKGESVEEIKLIFDMIESRGFFTKALYNDKEIPLIQEIEIYDKYPDDVEEFNRVRNEIRYNGDVVATTIEFYIRIMMPIEQP